MRSEATTGVSLQGPAFASRYSEIFIPRKMEFNGLVTDYKQCNFQVLTANEVIIFIKDLQKMVSNEFHKYIDWDKPGQNKGLVRPRRWFGHCEVQEWDQYGNDDRDARNR